jgi:nucleoside-diphosphate-sugar epimerase
MRVVVVGQNSFLAGHVLAALRAAGMETVPVSHDDDLPEIISGADAVVNCAWGPDEPGREFDGHVARLAAAAGAAFTMLSSRRVYAQCWQAREEDPAPGGGTPYGDSKVRSEAAVRQAGGRWTILRGANIFGDELGRDSFMGRLLGGLCRDGRIVFDMAAQTRRDFLPAETAAAAIARQVASGAQGIFNLGSGIATPCGDVAKWVIEGHGSGVLVVTDPLVRDEFRLDIGKAAAAFGLGCDREQIRQRCLAIGRKL